MTKQELKEWYKACDFIKKEMQFYSIKDFWANANDIRFYFNESNSYVRQMYQWYVFANTNISIKQKEMIWDYVTRPYTE